MHEVTFIPVKMSEFEGHLATGEEASLGSGDGPDVSTASALDQNILNSALRSGKNYHLPASTGAIKKIPAKTNAQIARETTQNVQSQENEHRERGARDSGPDPFGFNTETQSNIDMTNRNRNAVHIARSVPNHSGIPENTTAFAVLTKMFLEPSRHPVPTVVKYLPGGTEIIRSKRETNETPASPVMWADTLMPYSMQIGADFKYIRTSYQVVGVDVITSGLRTVDSLRLSNFGIDIMAMADAEIKQSGAIRSLIPTPGLKDQRSIVTLYHLTRTSGDTTIADEAALVRLLCLHMLKVDPGWHVYGSNSAYDMSLNARPVLKTAAWEITEAVATSNDKQIPTAEGTSIIYRRTLDQYVALMAQSSDGSYGFTRVDGNRVAKRVDMHEVTFIPVKMSWRGQSWLWPYILSFTTTLWWNHSHLVKFENDVSGRTTASNRYSMKMMPRAGIAYIPGSYNYICLVIVDATTQSFSNGVDYALDSDFGASFRGNADFAKKAMSMLGRVRDNKSRITADDTVTAWRYMCEIFGSANVARSCLIKASILCTSKFAGFSVLPTHEGNEHIHGTTCFDIDAEIKIDDTVIPDWEVKIGGRWEERARFVADWRVDPLYHLPVSTVTLGGERPMLRDYVQGESEYVLTTANHNLRVLRMLGVFEIETDCDAKMMQTQYDLANTLVGYGSLMTGLMTWILADSGVTIGERNRLGKKWKSIGNSFFDVMERCTAGFDKKTYNRRGRYFDMADNALNIQNQLALSSDWLDTWYSLVTPWWYAAAVGAKFGLKTTIKTQPEGQYFVEADMDDEENEIGWLINKENSNQLDICYLTSSLEYERRVRKGYDKYFTIVTPDSNSRTESVHKIGWYYYALPDEMKRAMRSRTVQPNLVEYIPDGIVCLNTVVFPSARLVQSKTHPQAFVDHANRCDPSRDMLIEIVGDLRWPDPFLDWLKEGLLRITPHLLRGDFVGATATGLGHIAEVITNWVAEKTSSEAFRG